MQILEELIQEVQELLTVGNLETLVEVEAKQSLLL